MNVSTSALEEATKRGRQDYLDGVKFEDVPSYTVNDLREAWKDGWYEQKMAEDEREDDEADDFDDGDFMDPVEADADVLRMAGYGTDEDYGYFGGDEF